MTDNCLFSIIIPTYNSAKTIKACLSSLLEQQFRDFEILLIDGVSKDETLSIAQSFNDQRIKIIAEKDNGIYDAMNKGIDLAKGKWFYFLGSDDSLQNPSVLSEVKLAIESHPKSLFFYGDVLTSANYVQRYKDHTYQKLINLNICHQAIFYHYTLFEHNRYNLKYAICADWDFNLKVFRQKNNPTYLNKVIANYSLDGASNNWGSHPDFINNFKPLTMVLRYRSVFYFTYLYILKQLKNIKSLVLNFVRWISR